MTISGTIYAHGLSFTKSGYALSGGTLNLGQLSGGTVPTISVNTGSTTGTASISSVLAGLSGLTKTGNGQLTLSGNNTYSGTTTITAGSLVLNRSGGTLADGSDISVAGGTLTLNYADTVRSVTLTDGRIGGSGILTASTYSLQNGTIDAVLAGTGVNVVKTTAGTVTLTAVNTFTGTVAINEGKLVVAHEALPGALSNDGVSVNVNGGTLSLTYNETVASFTLTNGNVTNETSTVRRLTSNSRIDVRNGAVDAFLNGTSGLTKSTAGTVTLNGANTYTGTTLVNGGTLRIGKTGSLATGSDVSVASGALLSNAGTIASPVTVASGGTLFNDGGTIGNSVGVSGTLYGSGTVGAVTLSRGGVISAGSIGSIGTLTTGSETWNGGASYAYDFNSSTGDLLKINGGLSIAATGTNGSVFTIVLDYAGSSFASTASGTTWTLATASGGITGYDRTKFAINSSELGSQYNGLFSLSTSGGNLLLTYTAAVPEPATYALCLGLGTLAFIGLKRYRQRRGQGSV